ncbi:MAG: peptidoglycan recognition family protein [Gallionella sp.]
MFFNIGTIAKIRRILPAAVLFMVIFASASDAVARKAGSVRTQPINMVVIHSTGGPTCDSGTGKPIWVGAGTLDENIRHIEADPKLGIHYMIDRDGTVRVSVPEEQMVNHVYHYSGRSVAIELINNGDGVDPFPEAQLASLVNLLRDIVRRHGISRDGVKRHSDLDHGMLSCDKTQRRKVDPGAAFPFAAILERVYHP